MMLECYGSSTSQFLYSSTSQSTCPGYGIANFGTLLDWDSNIQGKESFQSLTELQLLEPCGNFEKA